MAGIGATAAVWAATKDDLAALGGAISDGISAGREAIGGLWIAAKNRHVEGKIRGEINVINEHFGFLSGSGGHGDPNDPRNRDKWKKDIRRHLDELKRQIDRLRGDRNKEPWLDRLRQLEEQLRNTQ